MKFKPTLMHLVHHAVSTSLLNKGTCQLFGKLAYLLSTPELDNSIHTLCSLLASWQT